MRTVNAMLSLVLLSTIGVGCAAQTEVPDGIGADVAATSQALQDKGRLLALGDSIAFGYNPFGDFSKDKNFAGYPEALQSDFSVKNASCPGETSKSFFDNTAPDNGCRSYKSQYPLHVNYGNNVTQMDYALSRIMSSQAEDVPTQITLNLAGNDVFLKQAECAGTADPGLCFSQGAQALIGAIANNTAMILYTIRGAGYSGPITVMNLYATTYTDQNTLQFLAGLNGAIAQVAHQAQIGAKVADAFGAFAQAAGSQSPCDAGLLIPDPNHPGTCDVHPTQAGQAILADAVRNAQ